MPGDCSGKSDLETVLTIERVIMTEITFPESAIAAQVSYLLYSIVTASKTLRWAQG
jgi:hypothetical protein